MRQRPARPICTGCSPPPRAMQSIDLQSGALNPDYAFFRLDTFHQLIFPHTYFGWLSLVPSVGFRATYYSTTGNFTEADVNNPLPEGILVENGGRLRFAFNTDLEASFKLSKPYESVQQRWLGLDGLRHIIQPYADFSWVSQPTVPSSKILPSTNTFQVPRCNHLVSLSTRRSIHLIAGRSCASACGIGSRLGATPARSIGSTLTPILTSTSTTRLPKLFLRLLRAFPGLGPISAPRELFSNVFNRVRFQPVPWAYLSVDSQVPLLDKGFWSVTTAFDWIVNPNIEMRVGHQYLQSNPNYVDTSELSFYTYLRLNDNWGFSIYEDYEFKGGIINQQTYALHRDLSSWVAALGLNMTNNGSGKNQIAVVLTFTLKDLPRFGLPINLDVGNAIGQ